MSHAPWCLARAVTGSTDALQARVGGHDCDGMRFTAVTAQVWLAYCCCTTASWSHDDHTRASAYHLHSGDGMHSAVAEQCCNKLGLLVDNGRYGPPIVPDSWCGAKVTCKGSAAVPTQRKLDHIGSDGHMFFILHWTFART